LFYMQVILLYLYSAQFDVKICAASQNRTKMQ